MATLSLSLACCAVFLSAPAQAAGPREKLAALSAQLRDKPEDRALREELIRLALTLKPAPEVPAEAARCEGRAEYAFQSARSPSDFSAAAAEYAKALLAAPWSAADYRGQAEALDKAGRPQEAKQSFELYLLAAPSAADAAPVRERIAALQSAVERARTKGIVDWVTLPGGSFMMGSNEGDAAPAHAVTLRPFQLARTLVTYKQYRACMAAGACTPPDEKRSRFNRDEQPVVGVDWSQAQAFCQWVGGRLPSEAEWEYAARSGGQKRKFPWGNQKASCELAVIREKDSGCGRRSTWPVCSKPAGNTEQGLCDMAGNALEWLQDWYHNSYKGAPVDGRAWEKPAGVVRSIRGGSWYDVAQYAGSTVRYFDVPARRLSDLGFRPARDLPPPPKARR